MKVYLTIFSILTSVLFAYAQDTTVVQTLTFDDITQRRGVWQFPDSTHEWRKIWMELQSSELWTDWAP